MKKYSILISSLLLVACNCGGTPNSTQSTPPQINTASTPPLSNNDMENPDTSSGESMVGTTEHTNTVCFNYYNNGKFVPVDAIQFSLQGHEITPNQPWDGISTGNQGCLNVLAGRHNSQTVVNWVKTQDGLENYWNIYNALGLSTNATTPANLNFAFIGTLTVKYSGSNHTCLNVVIAQGHDGDDGDNWWIFANQPSNIYSGNTPGAQTNNIILTCSGGNFTIYPANHKKVTAGDGTFYVNE